MTPKEECVDIVYNCPILLKESSTQFCMHPMMQENCAKSCGICKVATTVSTTTVTQPYIATTRASSTMKLPLNPPPPTDVAVKRLSCIDAQLDPTNKAGKYIKCGADGMFELKQCNPVERACWCAYPHGQEVDGTRSFFEQVDQMVQMSCSANSMGIIESSLGGEDVFAKPKELTKCQKESLQTNAFAP